MSTHGGLSDGFEYYLPSTTESTHADLTEGLVVVDTNVLLNLYRYNERTRSDLMKVLAKFGDRLFVPHQVAFEFWERREKVIHDASGMSQHYADELQKKASMALDVLNEWKNRVSPPATFVTEVRGKLEKVFAEVAEQVRSLDTSIPADAARNAADDEVLNELLPLLRGRVGAAPDDATCRADDAEAQRRAKAEIPPGYKDDKKPGEKPFGDYRVWAQACREALVRGLPLLIVTDDRKEDWWHMPHNKRFGPRRELSAEFTKSGGVRLNLMTPPSVLLHAREALGIEIADESVQSAKTVRVRGANRVSSAFLEKMPSGRDGQYAEHILTMTRCAQSNPDVEDFIDAFMEAFPSITRPEVARRRVGTLIALGLIEMDDDAVRLTSDGEAYARDGDVELLRELFMRRVKHAETIRDLARTLSREELSERIYGGQVDNLSATQGTRIYQYMRALDLIPPKTGESTGPVMDVELDHALDAEFDED
ncbi:PIN-like domain-containing protein [Nocardioides sp. C4-1]|uniref:PIN-like domain-containing protein n=1 Tax=Nocardioides sp. C4-1 TaxID=3151851 RepID=UPI00326439E1